MEAVYHVWERLDAAGTGNCQLPRGSERPRFNSLLGDINSSSVSKSPLSSSALARKLSPQTPCNVLLANMWVSLALALNLPIFTFNTVFLGFPFKMQRHVIFHHRTQYSLQGINLGS